jgi:predicted DNA-binding ribbon-helix-helix protein
MSEEKPKKPYRQTKNMRAHSFSMEQAFYRMFIKMCQERGLNASAVVRRLMNMQMVSWAEKLED